MSEPFLDAWLTKRDRPEVVVLGNEKGGSGKTTVAIHLAYGLAAAGLRVGTIDLDGRQATFSRFVDNRRRLALNDPESAGIIFTDHRRISLSRDSREDMQTDEKLRQLVTALDSLSHCQYVVVDTPGSDHLLCRAAHVLADLLITPLNSSFLDLDALVRVDREANQISGPSAYSEMVVYMSDARAELGADPIEWLVLTNRIPNVPTRVHRQVTGVLQKLSERLGFSFLPSLHERVIFRELFLKGMTVLDEGQDDSPPPNAMASTTARDEVEALVDGVLARGPYKSLAAERIEARKRPKRMSKKKSAISFENFNPTIR
ncbi:MAG TPA: division plane positioning ATPase MipZ [Alphaproteobacteria bacterium]|nr:division plane positioning ATPase MipZ [Alphaproteobacteria bacterium]